MNDSIYMPGTSHSACAANVVQRAYLKHSSERMSKRDTLVYIATHHLQVGSKQPICNKGEVAQGEGTRKSEPGGQIISVS